MVGEKLLQYIQHSGHLGENEHPVALCLELSQQHCQRLQLSTIILDEPQVRKLGTHVTYNTVQRTSPRPELMSQLLLEGCLTWGQPRRWVAGVQGRGRCLHRRHDKDEPLNDF